MVLRQCEACEHQTFACVGDADGCEQEVVDGGVGQLGLDEVLDVSVLGRLGGHDGGDVKMGVQMTRRAAGGVVSRMHMIIATASCRPCSENSRHIVMSGTMSMAVTARWNVMIEWTCIP